MKILHVHSQPSFQGGIERVLYDMASSLSEYGDQGLLFTDGGSEPQFFNPFAWQGMSPQEAASHFNPDISIVHKVNDTNLVDTVIKNGPTLIFVHDHDLTCPRKHKYFPGSDKPCNNASGITCLRKLCFVEKAPKQDLIPVKLMQGIYRQKSMMASYKKAGGFIVASQAMHDELAANGIKPEQIVTIPPIPKSLNECRASPLPLEPRILFVGQIIRGKGVDLLLHAMHKIRVPCSLTIVGEGNHKSACMQIASKLGLADRVEFVGWIDHDSLDRFYHDAQMAVVPSRWPEPFGMVGIEAMARGRPVVAFNSGGISDWLSDGLTGLLAEPGNTSDLAEKLQRLLTDRPLREEMASNALREVQSKYSHDNFIQQLFTTMREHLG